MNILFLTLANVYDLSEHDIYQDLMRCLKNHGNNVYIVTGAERRKSIPTSLYESCGCSVLRVKVGNQSGCNLIEKGLSTLRLQSQYFKAISKHLSNVHFDLILYSTPPITIVSLIDKLKRKHKCTTYLMLKDIFPQNAVDLGIMSKRGLLYKYFRKQEINLYKVSDYIGCMSEANMKFLTTNNTLDTSKVEICPNAISPLPIKSISIEESKLMRRKYAIPDNVITLVFGGNLGRPQGIPFLIDCLDQIKEEEVFVVIVGDGTEFNKIDTAIREKDLKNTRLIRRLPRDEYLSLIQIADIGLIFLDYRFTIPNFPSRLLSYMEYGIPVICATDIVTDIGNIVEENGFGWKCQSNSVDEFASIIRNIKKSNLKEMGNKGRRYLEENYDVSLCYSVIVEKCSGA